ncbi:RagB/SusD family nutrient uptake outer membrane protein [Aridibaculum aurantiacum]|uniref:RagB/SusD family nutrient uptake outer membrane protein n=1 Tax=Aridibaculum aurantiacum TaxID=2810307 RepID=UPI001A97296E|nr:RagB/SusD family nutrient uptake outer membrane protein [Aridibaculum aurantiacum]
MRTSILSVLIMLMLLPGTACKKFLDRAPSVNLNEEAIFADPILASQFADNAYNHLVDEYARFNNHRGITGQAADEAVSGNSDVGVRTLVTGSYHDHYERGGSALNDISDIWARAYSGIRVTNKMLENIDRIPWTLNQSPARIRGEMHFLRAFLYFELIKRFGGVPLITRTYGVNEDIDIPRNTYEECVSFIVNDLNTADPLLPSDYNNSNNGRATAGAARALKSRVLLYAASKLNNESNDVSKWQAAAAAAKAVMDMGQYSLQSTYADILNVASSPEYIMIKVRGPRSIDGFLLDFAMSPGSGGAQGQLNPTQNHVDLYEMTNGKAITDPTSGYNPQMPYQNRDPRLRANILYNDVDWQGRKIQMWSGGRDYLSGNVTYTATRYYSRKMWPEPYIRNVAGTAILNYVFFRYAEILLNYAEAQNEALSSPDQSVYDAINQIRARPSVAMPPLPAGLTKDDMRKRIRNERAVELAFEDIRWYDIMRWKAGPEIVAQPMYGMNVVRNANGTFTYNRELLPANLQKVYQDHMHRYPIPRSEIYKSKGILVQNPGW